MEKLDQLLSAVQIEGVGKPLAISVSHAFDDFADLSTIEAAIESADAKMYREKRRRKHSASVGLPLVAIEQFASAA